MLHGGKPGKENRPWRGGGREENGEGKGGKGRRRGRAMVRL